MTDRLDDAIDRAVREMLDVEPPPDLRARVIARLPAAGSRLPAFGFRLPASSFQRFAALAGAAALLVLALVLAQRSEPPVQTTTVARAGDVRLPSPASNAQPSTRATTATATTVPARGRASRPVGVTVDAASTAAVQATRIEPLKTITPITVAPIVESSIAPDPIAVRPLTPISEVQIAPLNPPDRRD